MYKINVKVESNKVDIISQTVPITSKSLNVFKCVFDLPVEYEGLNCVAVFTYIDKVYKEMIVDNECIIPKGLLDYDKRVKIGVYAFKGEDLVYSPVPSGFKIEIGSYTSEESAEETENTQNAFDKWVEKANELYLKIEKADTDLDTKVAEINEKLENGDFNGKDGVDGQNGKDGVNGQDGADGRDGVDGQDGFSPSISVKPDTDDEYILEITNKDGKIETPNLKGRDGEKGDTGNDGKSAYEIAVEQGFEGTEQEWLDSLKGEGTDIDLSQYAKKEEVPLVYFWDGNNSTQNPDNIQFFQEILDKYLEGKDVLVINNSIQNGMRMTLSYTFDKTKEYELVSNTLVSFAMSNQYSMISYNVPRIKLSVIDNIVNQVIKSSTHSEVEQFLNIKNANNTYYFIPTQKSHPVSKGYLDDIIGNINSILDAINGEVVGDEAVTLQDEMPIENDTNIDNEYEEIIEDGINYINNENEGVIENGNE